MSTPVHQLSPQQKLFSQNGGITIMNVLLINGSPHAHGCTDAALQEIAKALNADGFETTIYHIGAVPVGGQGDLSALYGIENENQGHDFCDTCGMPDFMCVFFVDHSSGGRLHQKNARRRDGKVGFAVFRRKNGRRESEGAA